MAEYQFERESRTPHSEVYSIEDGVGDAVGRVDLHFTPSTIVRATLCVPVDFDDAELQDLIAEIDERLVLTSDAFRADFIVTVWRGAPAGVYSEDDDEDHDEDEDEDDGGGGSA